MLDPNDPILKLYQETLGRNPDRAGYAFYNSQMLNNNMSEDALRAALVGSAEATGQQAAPTTGLMEVYQAPPVRDDASLVPTVDPTVITNTVNQGFASTADNMSTLNNNMNTGFTATNQNLNSGFASNAQAMNTGFNNVGNQISGVGSAVNSGFAGLSDNVAQTGQALADQANANTTTLANNQNSNTETLLGGQSALNDALNSASGSIRTNQQAMQGQLAQQGNTLAQYYADLMQGQQGIGSDVGAFASDFGNFRNQYDTDVTAATTARTQTQDMLTGGFDEVRDDMSTNAIAQQQGQANLMEAVGGANMGLARGTPTSGAGQASNGSGFASVPGMAQTPAQGANPVEGSVAAGVSTIRQNLPALLERINPAMQKNMVAMVGSFDQQGNLIPSTSDNVGNVVTRVMDRSGVLTIRGQDGAGNVLGQNQISVPQMFQLASQALRG